jgi:hypothetical protein
MNNRRRIVERVRAGTTSLYIVSSDARRDAGRLVPTRDATPRQAPHLHSADPRSRIELEPASGLVLGLSISVGFWMLAVVLLVAWAV